MNLSLMLHMPRWLVVFTIPQGSALQKGRHGLYHEIVNAAANVHERFGVYSWCSDSQLYYCGSFAQDYANGGFRSNLHGRIDNYLQNHKIKDTGHKNTNLVVFENINDALKQESVALKYLTFDSLHLGEDLVDYNAFSNNPDLVHSVESLVICSYRRIGQCGWNRT